MLHNIYIFQLSRNMSILHNMLHYDMLRIICYTICYTICSTICYTICYRIYIYSSSATICPFSRIWLYSSSVTTSSTMCTRIYIYIPAQQQHIQLYIADSNTVQQQNKKKIKNLQQLLRQINCILLGRRNEAILISNEIFEENNNYSVSTNNCNNYNEYNPSSTLL